MKLSFSKFEITNDFHEIWDKHYAIGDHQSSHTLISWSW